METSKKVRCVIYARCSTVLKQDPENQVLPCRQYAESRGYDVVEVYVDRISGTKERRPALDKMLADGKNGKFDVVVIAALDRLGRDVRMLVNLFDTLSTKMGIMVISLREQIDLTSSLGKAILHIFASVAQLERDILSERIKISLAVKKASAGQTGWACGRPVRATPEVIAQAKELRSQGMSLRQICDRIGGGIGKTTIARALKNSAMDVLVTGAD